MDNHRYSFVFYFIFIFYYLSIIFISQSADKNQAKFSYGSTLSNGYVYNCGFIPTVLNRALKVNAIGDELNSLCSNFGSERGGTTGVLISKDQFMITAGRDRVVRYWDLKNPNKSFRISNTHPNTMFTYNAYKDKKYHEIVFEELVEFEHEDYSMLNDNNSSMSADPASFISESKNNNNTPSMSHMRSRHVSRKLHTTKSVHQDIITDLKVIECHPSQKQSNKQCSNMLLTSSRDGVIKVWI